MTDSKQRLTALPTDASPISSELVKYRLTALQTLQISPLDSLVDFADAKTAARWVVGTGQTIYWRQCYIEATGTELFTRQTCMRQAAGAFWVFTTRQVLDAQQP